MKATLLPLVHGARRLLPLALLAATLGPSAASAHPLLETLGGLGPLNPLSGRFLATGGEAAYFNPALLPQLEEDMSFGLFVLAPSFDIARSLRPPGADISDNIYKAWTRNDAGQPQALSDRPLPTSLLAPHSTDSGGPLGSYLSVGLVKHFIKDHLSLGMVAVLPLGTFQQQTSRFADEREQYFSNSLSHELFGDRLNMMTIAAGLGGEITPWLSWGLGFTLGLSTTTVNPVYVPNAANQREILITSDTSVNTSLAPHFSLSVQPSDNVVIAATLHTISKTETTGRNRLKFWTYDYEEGEDAIEQRFRFVNGWEPLTIGTGSRVTFPFDNGDRLLVAADFRWRGWSEYQDRAGERPTETWNDTISATLGARYESGGLAVSLDAAWVPSPVPAQTGRENYIDNDRLGMSAGIEADFELLGMKLRGGLGVQIHRLLPVSTVKRTDGPNAVADEFPDDAFDILSGEPFPESAGLQSNNPGFPGFSSSGWLLGAGFSLKVDL
jgi:long-chain fatty acid transport protein